MVSSTREIQTNRHTKNKRRMYRGCARRIMVQSNASSRDNVRRIRQKNRNTKKAGQPRRKNKIKKTPKLWGFFV